MATKKINKNKWFKPIRGSYLPASSQGWLTYIPFISYLAFSFILAWEVNVTLAVKIYLIATQWLLAGLFMSWVARNRS